MNRIRRLLLVACLVPFGAAAQDSLDDAFERDVLVIAARHACLRFDVYLALSRDQQRRGLMFVREMSATTGMLFVYQGEAYHSMWMKNTYIPLDILFARSDGSVSSIEKDTTPQSLRSISSTEPVSFVLELNAGVTDTLGIEPGSQLIWEPAMAAR